MHPAPQPNFSEKLLRLALLVVVGMLAIGAAHAPAQRGIKPEKGAVFFNEPQLRTFQFDLSEPALNQLRQSPRSYVMGTVLEGGHRLTNVAFRLRGHGSFRSLEERPNFAVHFQELATNQTYRGLQKLMFNNSVQDETGLAEFLSTQLFRDAGLPAARVTHARVLLNGRDLGLYVVIEAMGRDFLKHHFKNSNGNLYEGGPDIDSPLEQDSGVRVEQQDRAKLAQACALTNRAERWHALAEVLDVDRFVTFAAMEMLTSHWDGYVLHLNNYRLYHNPTTGRFEFIAHGMDWTFQRPNLSIQVPQRTVLARALFDSSEGQKLYRERAAALFTNLFEIATITNRLERELAKIRTGRFGSNELAVIERGADVMRERVRLRLARVAHELAGSGPAFLKLDTNGVAPLTVWRAYYDGGTGVVDRVTVDGRPSLHIGAAGSNFRPSWRSLAYLPRGSYRYEASVKIAARGGIAAVLRTSGPWGGTTINSATDWRPLTFDFEVRDEAGHDVEFVCDFSGAEGEAWFDLNSLLLRRLGP